MHNPKGTSARFHLAFFASGLLAPLANAKALENIMGGHM
jgi:hypothetical protein